MYLERLKRTLPEVREKIERACKRAGRSDVDSVTIVAVTKGHPVEALLAAREVGLEVVGENRVQEARNKWKGSGTLDLTWQLVGHLQRNKVGSALELFSLIQSVDSLRLAQAIDKEAERRGKAAEVLIQINASGETSKHGFPVVGGLESVSEISGLANLRVVGLMAMAPLTLDESVLCNTFRRTRALFELCHGKVDGFEPRHLSLGMTSDYEVAVEEGSTMVRLGTALFGERRS